MQKHVFGNTILFHLNKFNAIEIKLIIYSKFEFQIYKLVTNVRDDTDDEGDGDDDY